MAATVNTDDVHVQELQLIGHWIEIVLLPSSYVHRVQQSAVYASQTESECRQVDTVRDCVHCSNSESQRRRRDQQVSIYKHQRR